MEHFFFTEENNVYKFEFVKTGTNAAISSAKQESDPSARCNVVRSESDTTRLSESSEIVLRAETLNLGGGEVPCSEDSA